jgi:DNA-binding GntR family transcriptional regulator
MTQGGASINTVTKAIRMLESEGYARAVQGVGVYAMDESFWGKTPDDMK